MAGALRTHRAPLLVESDAPRIVQARSELEGALRRAARAGGQDTLWTWLGSESGRDDLARPARVHPRGAAGGPARLRRGRAHERVAGALGDLNPLKGQTLDFAAAARRGWALAQSTQVTTSGIAARRFGAISSPQTSQRP